MYDSDIRELARIKYRCLTILPFSSLVSVITLSIYLWFRAKHLVASYTQATDVRESLNTSLYFAAKLGIFCESESAPTYRVPSAAVLRAYLSASSKLS